MCWFDGYFSYQTSLVWLFVVIFQSIIMCNVEYDKKQNFSVLTFWRDFFFNINFPSFFLTERQAKKAKGELVTSRQSFGQLCPFSRSNYEFFQLAQFFNLKIGLSWKFLLSLQSRSRRTTPFPHFLPADFSPSLTSLVNTISKVRKLFSLEYWRFFPSVFIFF